MVNLDPNLRPPRNLGDLWREVRRLRTMVEAKTSSRTALGNSEIAKGQTLMVKGSVAAVNPDTGTPVATIGYNAEPPPVPSGITIEAMAGGVLVTWSGSASTTIPVDFDRVAVHMSKVTGFTETPATEVTAFLSPNGGIEAIAADPVPHFVRLVMVNTSDTQSAATAEVAVTPLAPAAGGATSVNGQTGDVDIFFAEVPSATGQVDGQVGIGTERLAMGLPSANQPSAVRLPDGMLLLAYQSSGNVELRRSVDTGRTWTADLPALADTDPLVDLTAPYLSVHGARVAMIYGRQVGAAVSDKRGVWLRWSDDAGETWSTPARIDPADSYISSAGLLEPVPGELVAVYGGWTNPASSTSRGAFFARSSDGGLTWTARTQIGNSNSLPPTMATGADSQMVGFLNDASVGFVWKRFELVVTGDAVTGWAITATTPATTDIPASTAVTATFGAASLRGGAMVAAFPVDLTVTAVATSHDDGVTWTTADTFETSGTGAGAGSAVLEVAPNVAAVFDTRVSGASSDVILGYVIGGIGVSPFNDVIGLIEADPDGKLLTAALPDTVGTGPFRDSVDARVGAVAPSNHKARHAVGGADPLTPADIGALNQAAVDARVGTVAPANHKARHAAGGADPLTPADIGALDQTAVDARVSAVAPTVTMTSGAVGTGTFRDGVRAALNGSYAEAWSTYTPTFTAPTTNPTLANFTRTGRYVQRGKQVTFTIVITCNTAAGLGTGVYEFGLPVTARDLNEVVGAVMVTGPNQACIARGVSTTTVSLYRTDTSAGMSAANTAMQAGGIIRINGTYEAA